MYRAKHLKKPTRVERRKAQARRRALMVTMAVAFVGLMIFDSVSFQPEDSPSSAEEATTKEEVPIIPPTPISDMGPKDYLYYEELIHESHRKEAEAEKEASELPVSEQIRQLCWSGRLLRMVDVVHWPEVTASVTSILEYDSWGDRNHDILAKIVTREIGGLTKSQAYSTIEMEWSAVVWCVLNRAASNTAGTDAPTGKTVAAEATRPNAFAYDPYCTPFPNTHALVEDVVIRFVLSYYIQNDEVYYGDFLATTVGRTLPTDFHFFTGDGEHNHFRREWRNDPNNWDWSYPDPYALIGA